jgi:hypothetical protein
MLADILKTQPFLMQTTQSASAVLLIKPSPLFVYNEQAALDNEFMTRPENPEEVAFLLIRGIFQYKDLTLRMEQP